MYNRLKKPRAAQQLMASIILWACVSVVIGLLPLVKGGVPTAPFPIHELLRLLEPSQLAVFLVAGFIYFAVFAFIRHKSKKKAEQEQAVTFADLGLDEMGSALYAFGAILGISSYLGAPLWYVLASICCFGVGYSLKPSE